MIWIYTVCHRNFKDISADNVSRRLVVIGALWLINVSQCINGHDFHEIRACLCGSNHILTSLPNDKT